jgi:adenylylsulfate kinase
VAAISPYRAIRDEARAMIGNFVEVFVSAPLEECARRDVKGLYKKAMSGEIPVFTGVSDPYEEPLSPELVVDTTKEGPEDAARRVIAALERVGHLPVPGRGRAYRR